jgi:hypothetical protein
MSSADYYANLADVRDNEALTGVIIPEDVTVYDSAFGSYFYLRFAGRTVTVAHRYAKGRVVEYAVYQEGFWHNSYHRSLTEALEAAFRKITDMRDMGIAIEHRRVGVHTTNRFTDQSARAELVVGELSSVHRLFVAVAGHLDANSHVLTRSQLDADALLSRASRADTPSRMRTAIAFIVERLREQAAVLDTIAGQRDVDPPRPPRDDSLEERPSTNLTWDARFLRRLASVIEKDAAPARPQGRRLCRVLPQRDQRQQGGARARRRRERAAAGEDPPAVQQHRRPDPESHKPAPRLPRDGRRRPQGVRRPGVSSQST